MLWLKKPEKDKPKGPKDPPDANVFAIWTKLTSMTSQRLPLNTYQQYLYDHLPKLEYDSYGEELPLSANQQDIANRLVAILQNPIGRGRDLITSGQLDNDEAKALAGGAPAAYAFLSKQALHEMIAAGPPFPGWSEAVLGVLFGKNAAMVFGDAKSTKPNAPSGSPDKPVANPTPSEQMDNKKI